MISNMTEPYIRFCVATFKFQLKNAVQYWTDLKNHRTLHPFWELSNPKWKRQFSIEIISKMTEPYILCGDIHIPIDRTSHLLLGHSNSTEKDSSVSKWFQRWRTRTSFVVTFKSNWKRQFIIEMITKIPEHYIVCGDIQIPTEKHSSVSKWFQRSQNFTSSVGTFKFQQKKSSLVLKWFQRWQNYAFFVETIKFQLKNQFSIEMISRIKELYILCWDIQIPTEKRRLLFKWLQRWQTWHSLLAHSNFNWKNFTYFVGTFKFQLEKTVHYPNDFKDDRTLHRLGDPQIPTEKKNSVLKWFQRWQTQTSFVGTFKIQLKKTIQYRKGLKDRKTLHHLWGHSNLNWKRQFIIEMITKITEPYILRGDIHIPTEKDS